MGGNYPSMGHQDMGGRPPMPGRQPGASPLGQNDYLLNSSNIARGAGGNNGSYLDVKTDGSPIRYKPE